MSDESPPPPKPKPGSLRDRIAAFEQKPASNAPPPPAARPKPGHIQWKPRQSSPPPPPVNVEGGEGHHEVSKESIGVGGMSLKERMAALQGRGGFGAPAPAVPAAAPRPAGDRPKWKPPPAPVSPAENEGGSDQDVVVSPQASVKSPISAASDAEGGESAPEITDADKPSSPGQESEPAAAEGEENPEEEERKRRAAIAARMARLGGARIGMGPPVFAPKPRATPSSSSQPTVKEPVESPDEASASEAPTKIDLPSAPSETSLLSAESESSARSPPTSMPVPSGPRRAAPPRRRPPKSPGAPLGELPPVPTEESASATPLETAERDEKKLEEEEPPVEQRHEEEEEDVPAAEETEEEAAARRKRIADRIAKSGGINPFAAPRPVQGQEEEEREPEQEQEQERAEETDAVTPASRPIPADVEASEDLHAEADSEAEAPPPSDDEPEEEVALEEPEQEDDVAPPPLPPKIASQEAKEAKKGKDVDNHSPVALPTKTEEPAAVPVVDLSKPADVSTTLEEAENHSIDITEAADELKKADDEGELEESHAHERVPKSGKEHRDGKSG